MDTYPNYKTDKEFLRLVQPSECSNEQIIQGDHLNPLTIYVWNNILIYHCGEYQNCKCHRMPYQVVFLDFICRSDVVKWICRKELERNDLTYNFKKYLIGKLYLSIKLQPHGIKKGKMLEACKQICDSYNVSYATMIKHKNYADAIDLICSKISKLGNAILLENVKISNNTVLKLSKLSHHDLLLINDYLLNTEGKIMFSKIQSELNRQRKAVQSQQEEAVPLSIKQLPKYDPDSDITGLTLTIPSWISSINRVRSKGPFFDVTEAARIQCISQLQFLKDTAEILMSYMEEKDAK